MSVSPLVIGGGLLAGGGAGYALGQRNKKPLARTKPVVLDTVSPDGQKARLFGVPAKYIEGGERSKIHRVYDRQTGKEAAFGKAESSFGKNLVAGLGSAALAGSAAYALRPVQKVTLPDDAKSVVVRKGGKDYIVAGGVLQRPGKSPDQTTLTTYRNKPLQDAMLSNSQLDNVVKSATSSDMGLVVTDSPTQGAMNLNNGLAAGQAAGKSLFNAAETTDAGVIADSAAHAATHPLGAVGLVNVDQDGTNLQRSEGKPPLASRSDGDMGPKLAYGGQSEWNRTRRSRPAPVPEPQSATASRLSKRTRGRANQRTTIVNPPKSRGVSPGSVGRVGGPKPPAPAAVADAVGDAAKKTRSISGRIAKGTGVLAGVGALGYGAHKFLTRDKNASDLFEGIGEGPASVSASNSPESVTDDGSPDEYTDRQPQTMSPQQVDSATEAANYGAVGLVNTTEVSKEARFGMQEEEDEPIIDAAARGALAGFLGGAAAGAGAGGFLARKVIPSGSGMKGVGLGLAAAGGLAGLGGLVGGAGGALMGRGMDGFRADAQKTAEELGIPSADEITDDEATYLVALKVACDAVLSGTKSAHSGLEADLLKMATDVERFIEDAADEVVAVIEGNTVKSAMANQVANAAQKAPKSTFGRNMGIGLGATAVGLTALAPILSKLINPIQEQVRFNRMMDLPGARDQALQMDEDRPSAYYVDADGDLNERREKAFRRAFHIVNEYAPEMARVPEVALGVTRNTVNQDPAMAAQMIASTDARSIIDNQNRRRQTELATGKLVGESALRAAQVFG